jgi:predicted nucleic acid-binding Zn ribbon protein
MAKRGNPYGSRKNTGPQKLGNAISELFALRGYARVQGNAQLLAYWKSVAGEVLASQTKVMGLKRGALQIGVASAPLLSELAAFRKTMLLKKLQEEATELKIRDIKFILRGDIATSTTFESNLPLDDNFEAGDHEL